MKKVLTITIISVILLISLVSFTGFAYSEPTLQTIRITPDGAIEPASVPIQRNGNTYTFTDDICGTIVVEKEGITIDGAGHTLYGTYNGTRADTWEVGKGPNQELSNGTLWTMGIDFHVALRPNNLTVKNLNIKNFYIGIYLWTSHNTLTKSSVTDNIVGVLLSGDSNTILENHIARNDQGVFFGVNTPGNEPLNITMAHNSFIENAVQFSGCFCEDYNTEENMHTWDDGQKGNYWSDYNGTDTDGDGIGDTPYVIDILNQDRYPLTQILAVPPVLASNTSNTNALLILALVIVAIIAAATIIYIKKSKRIPQNDLNSSGSKILSKKIFALITLVIIVGAFAAVFVSQPWSVAPQRQDELDFTVSGKNDCLRFLTPTVETVYVPFKTGANEKWQLTIEPQMPGKEGWTDVYLYKGYWDQSSNHKCMSQDLYPIIEQIESTDLQIRTNSTFTKTFGESTSQSYTLLFIFPPGGQSTFHIKLDQIG